MKLTDAEWDVMCVLWDLKQCGLKEVIMALDEKRKWSKNTVHTYLTRMADKGLVAIDHSSAKPYSAALSRSECEKNERADLLHRIYEGNMSSLITAFIKDSKMKPEEVERLKKLLDEMEG